MIATDLADENFPLVVAAFTNESKEVLFRLTKKGEFLTDSRKSNHDVFIPVRTVTRYTNLYGDMGGVFIGCIFDQEVDAIAHGKLSSRYIKTISVELEI